MRRIWIVCFVVGLCLFAAACGKKTSKEQESIPEEHIVIGFSQLGAESDWRSANTESMKAEFTAKNGYELIFEDGQQKQANQITAIRTFIQQEVDYIVLAPVTETGWDTVLQEAKDAEMADGKRTKGKTILCTIPYAAKETSLLLPLRSNPHGISMCSIVTSPERT